MLPQVILHNAVYVDGHRIGFAADIELFYGLALRWNPDAVLVGGTIFTSDIPVLDKDESVFAPPRTTARDTRPLPGIADGRGRVQSWHLIRQ
jgi:2,5-diamino-6-(ribosylamino)-4(3H)-pyrimidinone 5'-phosphate reductase